MKLDTNKSLQQQLGPLSPSQSDDSTALAAGCIALYEKPLKDFTAENLRMMIRQGIGLKFLVPLAADVLANSPFAEGDYYPGDLLLALMGVRESF